MKVMSLSRLLAGAAAMVVGSVVASTPSNANSLQFVLTDCGNSFGCGLGNNFGTITITDAGANTVSVNAHLASGVFWQKSGIEGFAFNLNFASPIPVLSNVTTPNWSPVTGAPDTGFNS